jgi:hypothetical protein
MEIEDELRRPPPPGPYLLTSACLEIPQSGLIATIHLLQRAGRHESGLFWYGTKDAAGNGRVCYVVAPQQRMGWANYSISAKSMTDIVSGLRDGWRPLAQVHSHPGIHVEHSNYDDRMASIRSALSLVVPYYGHLRGTFPQGIGVHEFQNNYWHLLGDTAAVRRVRVCDGEVSVDDFR